MKIYNVEQNTEEWFQVRSGIPTASCFDKILSPTGKLSTQATNYMNMLLAENITNKALNTWEGSQWTERGAELEPDAKQFYEFTNNVELESVGFITNYNVGCSPDSLVGDDGLLEIKCPAPHTHIEYLLNQKVPTKYIPQIQGQLYVTNRKWCDWMSYHPELPSLIIRVERDESYITKLSAELNKFLKNLERKKQLIVKLGHSIKEKK